MFMQRTEIVAHEGTRSTVFLATISMVTRVPIKLMQELLPVSGAEI